MVLVDSQQRKVNILEDYGGEFKNKGIRSDNKYREEFEMVKKQLRSRGNTFCYCVWLQIKVKKINPRHKSIFSPYLPGFQNKKPWSLILDLYFFPAGCCTKRYSSMKRKIQCTAVHIIGLKEFLVRLMDQMVFPSLIFKMIIFYL